MTNMLFFPCFLVFIIFFFAFHLGFKYFFLNLFFKLYFFFFYWVGCLSINNLILFALVCYDKNVTDKQSILFERDYYFKTSFA